LSKYGTILADPPWAYERASRHAKLTGYSNYEYEPLTTEDLCNLPVAEAAADNAVLLLWTTWPMIGEAMKVIDAWGFKYTTGLPWVKYQKLDAGTEAFPDAPGFKPIYGVGYWMRGASEPILLAKRHKAASVRTPYVGLLSPNASHSRKPNSLYELAEAFPGPRLELFARRRQEGWDQLGDELPGDEGDVRITLPALINDEYEGQPHIEEAA
jgi:N6-adenosine-specific RNA methylase IME4